MSDNPKSETPIEKYKRFMRERRANPQSRRGPLRPAVEAITIDLLKTTPDEKLSQLVNDFIYGLRRKIRDSGSPVPAVDEFARSLPAGMRMVLSTLAVEGEICNGGFSQFFFNSAAGLAADAVAGFELLCAAPYADLMRRAIAHHTGVKLESSDLSEEFFSLRKVLPLAPLRNRYIRDHEQEFVTAKPQS